MVRAVCGLEQSTGVMLNRCCGKRNAGGKACLCGKPEGPMYCPLSQNPTPSAHQPLLLLSSAHCHLHWEGFLVFREGTSLPAALA